MPESKDLSQLPAMNIGGVDYDKLVTEHPELQQDYQNYLQQKEQWMQSLPPEAVPYIENLFSNDVSDMIDHKGDWLNRNNSTSAKLQKAIRWLKEKGIEVPAPFDWQKYPETLLQPYRGSKRQEFIDWDKYFAEHPELKDKYAQFQEETKGYDGWKRKKANDPRDLLNEMGEYPPYEQYMDRSKAPVSWNDYTDYIWNLPPEHQDRITPYFISQYQEPNYGDDSDTYGLGDEPDHGDARAHVTPDGYGKGWMIHYSPAAEQIAQEGFQKGVTLQDADTLTQTQGGSGEPGFNYAFDTEHKNPQWNGGKAVVFPGQFLNVHHGRNEDSYVLFDGRTVPTEQIFPIVLERDESKSGWSIYDASGRKLVDKKPLKEVIEWVKQNNGMLTDVKKKSSSKGA